MKKVTLITGNRMKLLVAKEAMKGLPVELEQLKLETPEIQSMNVEEVAKFSAKWAADKLGKPVIVNDTGFFIEALKGFPGVFAAYADKTISIEGIMKLMNRVKNRKAYFVEATAYCEPGKEPVVEADELHGIIADKPSGEHGWFTDQFFIINGDDRTMGSYTNQERAVLWPHGHWRRIAERIVKGGL
jgi:XTP/dITP diphosphohydrolase